MSLLFEITSPDLEQLIRNAFRASTPSRVSRFWRQQMVIETGRLKTALSIMISQEGPIGVTRAYRVKIGKSVRGVGTNLVGRVSHDGVPYAVVIEEGRRPGSSMPPPHALIPWVREFLEPGVEDVEDLEFLALRLARHIANAGTFQPGQRALNGQQGPGMRQFARTMQRNKGLISGRFFRSLKAFTARELFRGLS